MHENAQCFDMKSDDSISLANYTHRLRILRLALRGVAVRRGWALLVIFLGGHPGGGTVESKVRGPQRLVGLLFQAMKLLEDSRQVGAPRFGCVAGTN